MRAGVLVTGVLGLGTALVFAAAAMTATLFPNGTIVQTQWNGGWNRCFDCGGWGGAMPMPAPAIPMPFQPMPGGGIEEGDVFVNGVQVTVSEDMVVADEAVPAP